MPALTRQVPGIFPRTICICGLLSSLSPPCSLSPSTTVNAGQGRPAAANVSATISAVPLLSLGRPGIDGVKLHAAARQRTRPACELDARPAAKGDRNSPRRTTLGHGGPDTTGSPAAPAVGPQNPGLAKRYVVHTFPVGTPERPLQTEQFPEPTVCNKSARAFHSTRQTTVVRLCAGVGSRPPSSIRKS